MLRSAAMPRGTTVRVRWLVALGMMIASSADAQDESELAPRRRRGADASSRRVPISMDGGASVNPEVLTNILDNTVGLTPDDREAYFRILKLTEKLGDAEVRALAEEFREERRTASLHSRRRSAEKLPLFVDMFQHPEQCRGRPVTLQGRLRRLVSFEAGNNEQGFEELYEGWLYPNEGQSHPAVVIFTKKPKGLPLGGDITEEVSVSGYFLKMYGYEAHETARKAPLLLAETVRWKPQTVSAAWRPSSGTYIVVTFAIVIAGLLWAAGARQSRREYEEAAASRWARYDNFVLPEELDHTRPAIPSRNGSTLEPHH